MLRKSSVPRQMGNQGFTLIELVIVVGIIGVLGSIMVPYFEKLRETARVTSCVHEISGMQRQIEAYYIAYDVLPATLNDLDIDDLRDTYGNDYQYLLIATAPGTERQNQFGDPLNSSYDIYSLGKDGVTSQMLDAPEALDDIVRASDGRYFGLGSKF